MGKNGFFPGSGKISETLLPVRRALAPAFILVLAGFVSYLLPSSRSDALPKALSLYAVYVSVTAFASIGYYGCLLIAMSGRDASARDLWSIGKSMWTRAVAGELMYLGLILFPLSAGLFIGAVMFRTFDGGVILRAITALGAVIGLCALAWLTVRLALWKVLLLTRDISAWRSFRESYRISAGHFLDIFLPVAVPYVLAAAMAAFGAGTVVHICGVALTSVVLPLLIPVVLINIYRRIASPDGEPPPYVHALDQVRQKHYALGTASRGQGE